MYQVTWSKPQHMPSSGHNFVDTWAEVVDWITEMDEAEGVNYWTVSVVLNGSNSEHVEFYPESSEEKGLLVNNLAKVLPNMSDGEVCASLMNFASVHWGPTDMPTGFRMVVQIADKVAESSANDETKKKMH
jgi:hypothetical protein|tara:strand:+ start:505 stop:897 length:393 start_codon:yes stop_codon:yes gene_type:complete